VTCIGAVKANASNDVNVLVAASHSLANGGNETYTFSGTAFGITWNKVRSITIVVNCPNSDCASGVGAELLDTFTGAGMLNPSFKVVATGIIFSYELRGDDDTFFKITNTAGSARTLVVKVSVEYEPYQVNDAPIAVSDAITHTNLAGTLAVSDSGTHTDLAGTLTVSDPSTHTKLDTINTTLGTCCGGAGGGGTVTLATTDGAHLATAASNSTDIRQLVGWAVGVLLVLMFAPILFRLWSGGRGL
jgi:hypothetical protein